MNDFLWRVSTAEVGAAGPFSHFPGVDRILCVLEGTLALSIEGVERQVSPCDEPLAFPADVPTDGRPIGGNVRDLNVMVRRGACRATVERLPARSSILGGSEATLILLTTCAAVIEHGGTREPLDAFDALAVAAPAGQSIQIVSDGPCFAIRVELF